MAYEFTTRAGFTYPYPENLTTNRQSLEARVLGCLCKDISLMSEVNFPKGSFLTEEANILFSILKLSEKALVLELDHVALDKVLEGSSILKQSFLAIGGYGLIQSFQREVNPINFDAYYRDLDNSNAKLRTYIAGVEIINFVSEDKNKNATPEECYNFSDYMMNQMLLKHMGTSKVVNLSITPEFLQKCYNGEVVGIEYGLHAMSKNTLGLHKRNFTLISAFINEGKTTILFNNIILPIVKNGEKVLIYSNESEIADFQTMLLINVLTLEFKYWNITRTKLKTGNLNDKDKSMIALAQDLVDKKYKDYLFFVEALDYSMEEFEALIRKYVYLGVSYFALDTMKSENAGDDKMSGLLVEQSKRIYKTARKLDASVTGTYQLASYNKGRRYLDETCLSGAKHIAEVLDILMAMRSLYPDEYTGMSNEVKAYRWIKNDNHEYIKEYQVLDQNKNYVIIFLPKNRYGKNNMSVVYEFIGEYGLFIEIGYCHIVPDKSWSR